MNELQEIQELLKPVEAKPVSQRIPFKTQEELDRVIDVVKIRVYGTYSKRGEHRKETVQLDYDAEVEVPANFNKGHIKLAVNRFVRTELRGIRARTYFHDDQTEPVPCEHRRRVRDFISERGMRENERLKRSYVQELKRKRAEAEAVASGQVPSFIDNTEYDADGLAPVTEDHNYIA